MLFTLLEAAWRQWSHHRPRKPPRLPSGLASHAPIVVEEPAQPPAPSGVEACWGLALLAKMLWLFPIVCNGLSDFCEPSTLPRGELQVVTTESMLHFMFLGNVIMFIFSLCNLFYTLYITCEGEKNVGKYLKQRLALKFGEVTKQGDKYLGRFCQGCLWLGLGAEPQALEMVRIISVLVSYSPYNNSFFSPAPSFTSAFGWWQADKSTAEYFLWAPLPCRGKPKIPTECVLWVLTSSQCLMPTGSLSSPWRHLGRSGIQHKGPVFRASCQQFPSPGLQFSSNCSFTWFFHLCSHWKKAKQIK